MKQRISESNHVRRTAPALLSFLLLLLPGATSAQKPLAAKKKPAAKAKTNQIRPVDELTKLREEFINATKDYKVHLEKLRSSYEKDVRLAEDRFNREKEVFNEGLISKRDFEASERAVTEAKNKVAEINQRMAGADSQIADALLEAEAETRLAKTKSIPKGGLIKTAAFIRYNGGAAWALSDAWKVQRFFLEAFRRPLPIAVFGQGPIHNRWRLDHHNAMDVSVHPDGAEGQALLGFLRANGIPFLAFREAIPGTATGPHIHVGRPSHRY
jgi:hypothetical protein